MSDPDGIEGAAPDECVVVQTDEGDGEWNPFEEFHDEVELGPVPKVTARDGMPTNFAPYSDDRSDIPPLGPDTLVCMGVFDEFVVRGQWGDIIARVPAEVVERAPDGSWRVSKEQFIQHNPDPNPKGKVRQWVEKQLERYASKWVQVEPIRPPCRHYLRQFAPYYLNPTNRKVFRLCAARRTTEGAFMDLSDVGMYCCDLREPRHVESEDLINAFDRKKMSQGKHRKYLQMFEGFKAEEKPGPGGIFNG